MWPHLHDKENSTKADFRNYYFIDYPCETVGPE